MNGEQVIQVTVDADQLSLAIGKRGQNVRLSAKLVGCKVNIQKDEKDITFEEKVERAVRSLATIEGVAPEQAQALVNAGFLTVDGILALSAEELGQHEKRNRRHRKRLNLRNCQMMIASCFSIRLY